VLSPETVPICLGILAVVTLLNLRGLADAARAFLLPTMVFIAGLLVIIVIGLIHPLALHGPQPGRSLLPAHAVEAVSALLLLKAFSAGCSALTGVEAIANGVPLFKQPRVARAKQTELMLGGFSARCCWAWRCSPTAGTSAAAAGSLSGPPASALLTSFPGAKLGASIGRRRATSGHIGPRLPQVDGSHADARPHPAIAGACMACRRSGVRIPLAPRFRRSEACFDLEK
jgi:hypothetical protein